MNNSELSNSVAIIGLSCRFPGAENADQFWENIKNGVESISELTDEELIKSGVPREEINKPNYVKKVPVLNEIEFFDASFFGYTPREAKIMDPQHRLFLECCWKALEDSGYNPDLFKGLIGVFAGAGNSDYLILNLAANRDKLPPLEGLDVVLGNDRDYLCTRVAYNLNLKGPALSVQTACSTSLVAVHLACDSILSGQCDIALAGASSINLPMKKGYKYIEDGIASPDGHTYAFDKRGRGTIFGSGVGVVVLKRLKEAIEDRDNIYAVIKGTAINNDGSAKVGFVAPGVDGQSKVIAEALAVADVNPETISYVETHGTGTALGDPIEITALTKAYRVSTDKCGFCLIGSVKTNIGHIVAAAGIAGLIKTVLAIKNKLIPPSLNYENPNPQINFDETPFKVITRLTEWKSKNNLPIRAGVSSFGMGGTNAHVILEEAPVLEAQNFIRPFHLLMLSAKSKTSLDSACNKLAEYLGNSHSQNLTDISYTLQTGRKSFNHRRLSVVKSVVEAYEILKTKDPKYLIESSLPANYIEPVIAFLFSGQGSQHLNMCAGLYKSDTYFNEIINSCAKILERHIGINILDIIFSENIDSEESKIRITQTEFAQPALFMIEYALSKYLINIGIIPQFMVGHSIGEYVAACISGVMSLEDALKIVALRGKLMQRISPGAMLSVQMIEDELVKLLPRNLDIAAINAPGMTVVSGSFDAIEQFEEILKNLNIEFRRLQTSHAFHSSMMDPILQDFKKIFEGISLKKPSIPYLSNTTGDWITDDQATNPEYYVEHLRRTVRFSDNITKLLSTDKIICLEVGPGNALTSLAKKHSGSNQNNMFLPCTRHPQTEQDDFEFLLQTLGKLWLNGITINWEKFYEPEKPAKISLPTYQFDKQKHFIDYPPAGVSSIQTYFNQGRREFSDWFYIPGWYRKPIQSTSNHDISDEKWLIFVDEIGLGKGLIDKAIGKISNIIKVHIQNEFEIKGEDDYCLNLSRAEHFHQLFKELKSKNKIPDKIIYLRGVTSINSTNDKIQQLAQVQEDLFFGLLFLAQAIGEQNISKNFKIFNITNNLHSIIGGESLHPEKAISIGPCRVIPKEYNNITCCNIDIDLKHNNNIAEKKLIDRLFEEISDYGLEPVVALRGDYRWLQNFELIKLRNRKENNRFRKNGVYLITGGLGGLGLAIAENLAADFQARIVLLNRSVFPEKHEWDKWETSHNSDDEISKKIEKLKSIEQKGGEILVLSADVSKPDDMKNAMNEIKKRFGKLNGIIHAAGTINDGIVQLKSREAVENVLNPKVKGTLVLDSLANEFDLDFFVMFSSLNAVLAPAGQIDYCAANNFLDVFAQTDVKRKNYFVLSINWPGWQEIGLAAKVSSVGKPGRGRQDLLKQKGISPEEGVRAFRLIMGNNFPNIAVSTYDLKSELEQFTKFRSIDNIVDNEFQNDNNDERVIDNTIEQMNQIEETVADVWKEMIGIEKIKLNDNFFEIGGHSLLATQIISRLREDFQLDLSIKDIFTAPSVAEFAKKIEAKILDEIKSQTN